MCNGSQQILAASVLAAFALTSSSLVLMRCLHQTHHRSAVRRSGSLKPLLHSLYQCKIQFNVSALSPGFPYNFVSVLCFPQLFIQLRIVNSALRQQQLTAADVA
jgi:hypothetical protein